MARQHHVEAETKRHNLGRPLSVRDFDGIFLVELEELLTGRLLRFVAFGRDASGPDR